MQDPFSTPRHSDAEADVFPSPTIGQAAHDLRAATEAKAQELLNTAAEKATSVKAAATETAQHFKDSTAEHWQHSCVKAKELRVSVEDCVRQKPAKSVLCALGIGFLIGLIARREGE